MSSDSSEDEDLNKLREATDFRFINDSMFNTKLANEKPKDELPPSLRQSKDQDGQFNLFRVSPEFRNYVAKHLSNMLDQILEKKLSHKHTDCDNYIKPKRRKGGIKLFHGSTHFIKIKTDPPSQQIRKKIHNNVDNDDENDDKFRAVAVNPEDIISKKETKSWSNRSKAPVYTYLKTKDGLILK